MKVSFPGDCCAEVAALLSGRSQRSVHFEALGVTRERDPVNFYFEGHGCAVGVQIDDMMITKGAVDGSASTETCKRSPCVCASNSGRRHVPSAQLKESCDRSLLSQVHPLHQAVGSQPPLVAAASPVLQQAACRRSGNTASWERKRSAGV